MIRNIVLNAILIFGLVGISPKGIEGAANSHANIVKNIISCFCLGKAVNSTTVAGIFCAGGDTKFGFICDTITM